MNDLLQRLKALGLTEEQALQAIVVIKDFAKEKFPLFGGAIEKLFTKYNKQEGEDFLG